MLNITNFEEDAQDLQKPILAKRPRKDDEKKECPFCNKCIMMRNMGVHIKRFHLDDENKLSHKIARNDIDNWTCYFCQRNEFSYTRWQLFDHV